MQKPYDHVGPFTFLFSNRSCHMYCIRIHSNPTNVMTFAFNYHTYFKELKREKNWVHAMNVFCLVIIFFIPKISFPFFLYCLLLWWDYLSIHFKICLYFLEHDRNSCFNVSVLILVSCQNCLLIVLLPFSLRDVKIFPGLQISCNFGLYLAMGNTVTRFWVLFKS